MTTHIDGKFACSLSEKTFCLYMDKAGRDSLMRAGILKKFAGRGDNKFEPTVEHERVRLGIGFMRIGGGEPRLRLLPPDSPKALRHAAVQYREESDLPYWLSARTEAKTGEKEGLFDLIRRAWKLERVEVFCRDDVSPNEVIIGMPRHFVPVGRASAREAGKATLADAKGAEKLEELHVPRIQEPEPEAEPPAASEWPDEMEFGHTTIMMLGLSFKLPATEALRVADTWTRAGYLTTKPKKEEPM